MRSIPKLSAPEAAALAAPGARLYVAGCCGEPGAILDAVAADPELWRGVELLGAYIPGVNRRDLSAIGRETTARSIFATEGLRPERAAGRVSIWPAHYTELYRHLAEPGAIDIAYFQVPPPRDDGTVGFGLAADFSPAPALAGARLVGVINPAMPDVADGPRLPVERFSAFVDAEAPLIAYGSGRRDPVIDAIGVRIASLIRDGDTIQLGLGKMQQAVLGGLAEHRGLGFHSGMISDPILPLIEGGVFAKGITTGVALGSAALYERVRQLPQLRFRPVGETHAIGHLSRIERFISINSVIEVDLLGQANAEILGGRQVSGLGGMVDFVRGARASAGGRSLLALPATAEGGRRSRILAALPAGVPAGVSRSDVDCVVTEHGVAELRGASVAERAERLIAIAAPQFRDELAAQWESLQQAGSMAS
ncbi:MAG: acetyl-CoA hydrolase/transferase C-terminal domain-containing protein [Candidatus Kaistia colombiensis]|nr:MAG: acetyl-CoA hydrolase/transferase C-terminal domain-containing protein [Kaistia sp.]